MDVSRSPQNTSDAAVTHNDLANAIRALAMDAVQKAKSGHPGMPMGMADVATVLFTKFLKFDPARPNWPDRDRFVLSAGHGSMLLYSLLHLTGYEDMTLEEIRNFRQLGSKTAGHPEFGEAAGIETTTGPLGQGFGNAVGMALAERLLEARYGNDLIDHYTYVLASDGDLMEGISHEAAALAGHLRLGKLICLYDDNEISIDGDTRLADTTDHLKRFEAYGWATDRVDGHDPEAVATAIDKARNSDKPTLIACRTTIGFGAPSLAGSEKSHGAPLGEDEIAGARENLGWPHPPFEIPEDILNAWRAAGARGGESSAAWDQRIEKLPAERRDTFLREMAGDLPPSWKDALAAFKKKMAEEKPKLATRQASQKVIEVLIEAVPNLIGGSADLTGSNGTKTKAQQVVSAEDFTGSYIHYGVREHGMAATMNGMALHGGVIPYGGTFLVFSDYCRPSIRLSSLMRQRVVYVMTHDSIGLGEDGPTHQPIEHLAALRAMPNVRVFRPCDPIETAECWELALADKHCPSVLALTRQGVATVRHEATEENFSSYGAYILAPAEKNRQVTLIASGSEVGIALEAKEKLAEIDIAATVVSMPCWELFLDQPAHYRDEVLYPGSLLIGIEAASGFGWAHLLGLDGVFVGMRGFGSSAPAEQLYGHFNITADEVVEKVRTWL